MADRGGDATKQLMVNVQDQLSRIVMQLSDLEELRDDLDDDEYEEQKKDTLDELKDFEATLETMKKDNVTLVAEVDKVQLEMQAAIRNTFKAEIRDSFKKGEPEAIRTKMAAVDRDHKLGKLSDTAKAVAMAEMAGALKSMGEELTDKELKYLAAQESSKAAFEDAGSGHGGADVLDAAAKSVAKESKA